jgi:hypothetical protein
VEFYVFSKQVAARTLGDIVKKLGEKVLPEIIPILEEGLESSQSEQRQGVCIGLSEIMSSTSREHVVVFADSLIPTVRKALCDPLPEVREAAAETFSNLHSNIGPRALDDILPYLLAGLVRSTLHAFFQCLNYDFHRRRILTSLSMLLMVCAK